MLLKNSLKLVLLEFYFISKSDSFIVLYGKMQDG